MAEAECQVKYSAIDLSGERRACPTYKFESGTGFFYWKIQKFPFELTSHVTPNARDNQRVGLGSDFRGDDVANVLSGQTDGFTGGLSESLRDRTGYRLRNTPGMARLGRGLGFRVIIKFTRRADH